MSTWVLQVLPDCVEILLCQLQCATHVVGKVKRDLERRAGA